ncbi:MAG: hypothetical protein ABI183_23225 [Polyangiaceae bacterium]
MRFNRMWVVGLVASTSAMWIACGGDDAAVNNGETDSGVTDATTGDGNTGTDSGNPSDAGVQDSAPADDGACHVAFPSLPAGEIVCPGAPGGACTDGGSCCANKCIPGDICISTAGHMTCERASDCKNNHTCCLKLASAIDLNASACPLTATASSSVCATLDTCPPDDPYVACASDAECDGGKCRALSVQVLDGGTILGVCAP